VLTGVVGDAGCAFITRGNEAGDIQPSLFVTVKVCVPTGMPVSEILVPDPAVVMAPGLRVSVQLPDPGNPFIVTLPVATEQVVCVTEPIRGAAGVGEIVTEYAESEGPQPPEAGSE
jgi:hypothetical protein